MSTIKLHTLRERIKRKLSQAGCALRAHGWEHGCCGTYVVWRRHDGKTMREIAAWDLIDYAREIGAMRAWESEITTLLDDAGNEVLPPAAPPGVTADSEIAAEDDVIDVDMPDCPVDTCVPR